MLSSLKKIITHGKAYLRYCRRTCTICNFSRQHDFLTFSDTLATAGCSRYFRPRCHSDVRIYTQCVTLANWLKVPSPRVDENHQKSQIHCDLTTETIKKRNTK